MDDNLADAIIEAIIKIGNCPAFIKLCEPNVAEPMVLRAWMVKRVLTALVLLQQEADNDL